MGTYTLASQVKASSKVGSGSAKLAAFKAATSSGGSSRSSGSSSSLATPRIKQQTEAERQARMLITSTSERQAGIDRTKQALAEINSVNRSRSSSTIQKAVSSSTVPSVVKDVAAWQASLRSQTVQQSIQNTTAAQAALQSSMQKAVNTGYNPADLIRGYQPESETLVAKVKQYVQAQQAKGQEIAGTTGIQKKALGDYSYVGSYVPEQYADIVPSVDLYRGSKKLATSIRKYKGSTAEKVIAYPLVSIGGSPVESVARLVEMGGMVAGGVETLATRPDIIIPSVVTGAAQTVTGLGTSIKEEPAQLISDIAVSAILSEGVVRGVKPATKYVPKVQKLELYNIVSGGADPVLEPISYGRALTVKDTPVVSYGSGKVGFGAVGAEPELLAGKTITAYGKTSTKAFEATVKRALPEQEGTYFASGKKIATKVYETNQPLYTPESFEVLSANIPEAAKPIVEQVIREYPQDMEVFGSVTQKQQLGKYQTRVPKDIEIRVTDPTEFVSMLSEKLEGTGIEYHVKAAEGADKPKVYFGEKKGIELFKLGSDTEVMPTGTYKPTEIAYGFEEQAPLVVEGIKTTRLSEQAARKLEGGHTIQELSIEPKHAGRVKDIGDLIEIGTGYSLEKGLKIEGDIVQYTKIAAEKYPELIGKSKIVEYIAAEGKLPSALEIEGLGGLGVETPELLLSKTAAQASGEGLGLSFEPTVPYMSISRTAAIEGYIPQLRVSGGKQPTSYGTPAGLGKQDVFTSPFAPLAKAITYSSGKAVKTASSKTPAIVFGERYPTSSKAKQAKDVPYIIFGGMGGKSPTGYSGTTPKPTTKKATGYGTIGIDSETNYPDGTYDTPSMINIGLGAGLIETTDINKIFKNPFTDDALKIKTSSEKKTKAKKKKKAKGFRVFIENPIASPFSNNFGSVNHGKNR